MKNIDKMRQLWFLLKGDKNRTVNVPPFYYDEELTFFLQGSQALELLEIMLYPEKFDKPNFIRDLRAWRKYLEENSIIPSDREMTEKMNENIRKGIPEPIRMPRDIRLARLVAMKMDNFKGFRSPESYPLAVSVNIEGKDILYVPVHVITEWMDEWLNEKEDL